MNEINEMKAGLEIMRSVPGLPAASRAQLVRSMEVRLSALLQKQQSFAPCTRTYDDDDDAPGPGPDHVDPGALPGQPPGPGPT
eukprot:3200273-Karenia_brevis.AAC.1